MIAVDDLDIFKCPKKIPKNCGCLEKYIWGQNVQAIVSEPKNFENKRLIFQINQKARELHEIRCIETNQSKKKTLGSGKRKSIQYIDFVAKNRKYLKDAGLCEEACKKVLLYSNNLIHRKLKFDDENRNQLTFALRTKGKALSGKLQALESVANLKCCNNHCVKLIDRLPNIVSSWRMRALEHRQEETRHVLKEMLLPSANGAHNCYNFIHMITGVSRVTIRNVFTSMKEDSTEIKQHGLVKYHKTKLKKNKKTKCVQQKISNQYLSSTQTLSNRAFSTIGSVMLPIVRRNILAPAIMDIPVNANESLKFDYQSSVKMDHPISSIVNTSSYDTNFSVFNVFSNQREHGLNTINVPSSQETFSLISFNSSAVFQPNCSITTSTSLNGFFDTLISLNPSQIISNNINTHNTNFGQLVNQNFQIPDVDKAANFLNPTSCSLIASVNNSTSDIFQPSLMYPQTSLETVASLNTNIFTGISTNNNSAPQNYIFM